QYYPSLRVVHDARKLQAFRCVASIILRATHLGGRPQGTSDVRQTRDVTCGSDMSAMPLGGGTTLWDTMSLNCAPIEASRVGMFDSRLKAPKQPTNVRHPGAGAAPGDPTLVAIHRPGSFRSFGVWVRSRIRSDDDMPMLARRGRDVASERGLVDLAVRAHEP